jgi:hypothetical protein
MITFKSNIYLKNNSASTISIGNLSLAASESVRIWSSKSINGKIKLTLPNIFNNISIVNQNIQNNNLQILEDTTVQSISNAFLILDKINKLFYANENADLLGEQTFFSNSSGEIDGYTQIYWTLDSTSDGLKNQGSGGSLDLSIATGSDLTGVSITGECRVHNGSFVLWSPYTSIGETSGSFTVSFWANLLKKTDGVFICKSYRNDDTWATPFVSWSVFTDESGDKYKFNINDNSVIKTIYNSNLSLNDTGNWHLYSLVYNQTDGKAYQIVDGTLVSELVISGPINWGTHGRYVIGGNNTFSSNLTMKINSVKIENTARSLDYLKILYKQGLSL